MSRHDRRRTTRSRAPGRHVDPSPRHVPAAARPRPIAAQRLLQVDATRGQIEVHPFSHVYELLRPGDLLVVNDASTLPAALPARTAVGEAVEVRLIGQRADGAWRAALLGSGTWRDPTERRGPPPSLRPGDVLRVGRVAATVLEVDPEHPALVALRSPALLSAACVRGAPVRYSYLGAALPLDLFQSPFATRPVAAEMPSAGRPLRWRDLLEAVRRGVHLAAITHAAGLSSVDGGDTDRALPLPERCRVPQATVDTIAATRDRGGRVIAVGTTVVRALEGSARDGVLRAGEREVDLVIGPTTPLHVVDGVLSTVHEPGTSHLDLLTAFAPAALLAEAAAVAAQEGFVQHEFGDSMWVVR